MTAQNFVTHVLKLIPLVFEGNDMSLKMPKKRQQVFRKANNRS